MISEERVRIMTKMSLYENRTGAQDLKIGNYYKKDYSSFHTLVTVLWVTVGYVIIAALAIVSNMDALMKNLTMNKMIFLVIVAVGGYLIILIAYVIGAGIFYKNKHNGAKRRLKQYYRNLSRLGKIYKKESR
ncbi:MAG: hypothetical protein PHQ72_12510 [Hespellia sp.]|nr:hypothetical protein [Hespellia sp.]